MPEKISCKFFQKCGGCDHWDQDYDMQKQNKVERLRQILNENAETFSEKDFISVGPYGLRHRFDFTVESLGETQSMGLYGENRQLIDLDHCLQLAPELQNIFSTFRTIAMRTTSHGLIRKASVRLRIGPNAQKGVWLDLANVDIKALLDDATYLNELLAKGFEVEIGQKGKKLIRRDGVLKLGDPQALPWFRSKDFTLKSLISDFTQPSWLSGDALVDVVLNWVKELSIQTAIEFGPGVGQFTLPLLQKNIQVQAFENNPKATEVLQQNAKAYSLEKNLQIFLGDFQNKNTTLTQKFDLAFVNPPRSGLKNFVETVIATEAPYCIYISCFPESMQVDLDRLKQAGYHIQSAKIVDQFPQTSHFESCILLKRN